MHQVTNVQEFGSILDFTVTVIGKLMDFFRASNMEEKKVLELLEIIYSQHTAYMRYFTEEELKYFGVKILKRKK